VSLERAEKTLLFAGQALDPNAPSGPDLALARELLLRAALDAARVLDGGGDEATLEATLERVKAQPDAPKTVSKTVDSILGSLAVDPPTRGDLVTLEVLVRRLVHAASAKARGKPGILRRLALRIGLVTGVLLVVMGADATSHDWSEYRYRTSSAATSFRRTGRLGEESHAFNLLVHTEQEKKPWMEIDLREKRQVEEVLVIARQDCCRERGIPMVLEAKTAGKKWVQLARTEQEFRFWRPVFEPVEARNLRLRAEGDTILHLSDVQVR
jgi:hypothetical protein